MTDGNAPVARGYPESESAKLAEKLASLPLDQSHATWPTVVPVRLSETERELIVNVLRSYTPHVSTGCVAVRHEIETLKQLSEIERKDGTKQSTWQIIRDIAARLERAISDHDDAMLDAATIQIMKGLFPLGSTRDRSISADRTWDDLQHDLKKQIKLWIEAPR